jgi:multicomponent Na+:H+ antiporter subunit B
MSRTARLMLFFLALGPFVLACCWAIAGLPRFSGPEHRYGALAADQSLSASKINNAVTAVTFDIRGFDTLAEEFILFAAITGILLLLRMKREEKQENDLDRARKGRIMFKTSGAVVFLGRHLMIIVALVGLSIALHATVSPGGGFQGGVIIASVMLIFIFVNSLHGAAEMLTRIFEIVESIGMLGYLACGVCGWFAGASFLENILPKADRGELLSGGLVPLINFSVLLAVAGGFCVLLLEFVKQELIHIRGDGQ